jgi:hypothetical protein
MKRTLEIRKHITGQWQYRFMYSQSESPIIDWQFGTFDKKSTINQALDRFGIAEIVEL